MSGTISSRRPWSVLAGAAAVAVVAVSALLAPAQAAPGTTQKVTEANVKRQLEDTPPTGPWVLYTRPASPGIGSFVNGPATPPLGTGSLQLQTTSGSDKVWLFNYDHVGTRLADIANIGYSTYRQAGQDQQVAAMNLEIDYNGPNVAGGFTTLVFEPVYNTSQGGVVDGQWQSWTGTGSGVWWSTRDIPGVCSRNCFVPWNDIVAANPDATILGGVGINQGSGNPSLVSNVDAFTFDTTTYDFEAVNSKDDCKNDGYKQFVNPAFKSQGQCVSYMEHQSH